MNPPWLLAELEEIDTLAGGDVDTYSVAENRAVVATFIAEQVAQGLVDAPVRSDCVFAEFQRHLAAGEG